MLPLSSGRGWCLFWQDVASTDEQRDLAQRGSHGNIVLVPGTWQFISLPQKLMQLKKLKSGHYRLWPYTTEKETKGYIFISITSVKMQTEKQISGILFQFLFLT